MLTITSRDTTRLSVGDIKAFEIGGLYKVKSRLPVYLLDASIARDSCSIAGVSVMTATPPVSGLGKVFMTPSTFKHPKIVIPEGEVLMCLSLEELEDRRKYGIPSQESTEEKQNLGFFDTKRASRKNSVKVYELVFLWNEKRYVFLCSGKNSLKTVSDLFFDQIVF